MYKRQVIENGGSCPPEQVEQALLRCGYSLTDQVEGPGQFARRGGILDFFSPGDREPVRIEFWGDEIDSMGHFDTESQRRSESVDSCTILPAAETLPSLSPVSYTHLDVYKRQGYRRIELCWI